MGKYPTKKIHEMHDYEGESPLKTERHFKTILHLPGYNKVQNTAKNNQHRSISLQHQLTSVKSESCSTATTVTATETKKIKFLYTNLF